MSNAAQLSVIRSTTPAKRRTARRRATPKLRPFEKRMARYIVGSLGVVILVILGVSLEHLAHGIATVTKSAAWAAWSLSVAIDVGMVASEITLILLAKMPDLGVEKYAKRYVIATIVVSMALNTLGFWPADPTPVATALAVVLGCGIPAGVYHLTRVAGKVWLARSHK